MSHTIIPFSRSNLLVIKNNQYIFVQDECYTKNKIISYDFNTKEIDEIKITKPFCSFFNECIDMTTKYISFDAKEKANMVYASYNGVSPTYKYENIDKYPELKIFLSKSQSYGDLKIYGNDNYHLDVWHSQAYVISLNNEITAFHIDESYSLQEGDCDTFVWNFDDNFVVYNDGDVYSVIIIVKNF